MALITVDDITTYMDISFTNVQEDAAVFVIEGLQAELEAYLRRPIEPVEVTEQYRIPDESLSINTRLYYSAYTADNFTGTDSYNVLFSPVKTVYLNSTPIISVESLTITAPHAGAVAVPRIENVDFIVRSYGVDLMNVYANELVTITYTAGLDGEAIKIFKLLLLRAATREMQNMHDDVVGLKDLTTRNVAPLETGFTDRELNSVRRYRRVRV